MAIVEPLPSLKQETSLTQADGPVAKPPTPTPSGKAQLQNGRCHGNPWRVLGVSLSRAATRVHRLAKERLPRRRVQGVLGGAVQARPRLESATAFPKFQPNNYQDKLLEL